MTTIRKKIALGAGAIVALSVATWFLFPAAGQDKDITVCVGPDSIVRSPESGICPAGSQQVKLAAPEIKKLDGVDENDPLGPTKKEESKVDQQLAELERRANNLENAPLFEVVDKTGRVIFRVAPGRAQLYNGGKTAVAEMLAAAEGGGFVSRSAEGDLEAVFGAYKDRAGLRLSEGGKARLDLLRQEAGNYSLRIRDGDGAVAGIGESRAGTGAIVVGDSQGQPRASMAVNDGRGAVSIFNSSGGAVSMLSQASNGGGLLVLTDANSSARVSMLTNSNRYGVVMTFPSGFPYVPKSGLPGSYMLGCAGGPACVP